MFLFVIACYNIFSLARATWSGFDAKAKELGHETNHSIKADGECFLSSLQLAFSRDYGVKHSMDYLKEEIFDEIQRDSKLYVLFTTGSVKDLLYDTLAYLKDQKFTHNVVDVVVAAASKALKINLFIFSRNRVEDSVLLVPTPFCGSKFNILLKYNHSGGSSHGFDHYQPVLRCKKSSASQHFFSTVAY